MIIQLIYRYINVLLKETKRIVVEAYSLRAPGQKGINFKAWGSLPGQLLLRSIDRATDVHNSMSLRGYNFNNVRIRNYKLSSRDYVWMIVWTLRLLSLL
ncbi:MAG: CbiQ family ECF transporter T component [Eubacterium sp.]